MSNVKNPLNPPDPAEVSQQDVNTYAPQPFVNMAPETLPASVLRRVIRRRDADPSRHPIGPEAPDQNPETPEPDA